MTTTQRDNALASILLTTRLLRRDAAALSPSEYWQLIACIPDPGSLLGSPEGQIKSLPKEVSADRVIELLDGATALAMQLEKLSQSGIRVISSFDENYPSRLVDRLGPAAPPVLYVAGSMVKLQKDGVGIVGSRNVGSAAREVAADVARVVAAAGLSVVSGVARGIDQIAMSAALEAEGHVIGIPAESMNKLVRDPNVRRAITGDQMCLVTPFIPSAGFSVGAAMGRNKLIYALSSATLVVTSEEGKGGTWSGATEALEKGYGPVGAWTGVGAGEGNVRLIRRGATPITEPSAILAIERSEAAAPVTPPSQLRMSL